MTITYTLDVSSSKTFAFTKLLLRWRGSVWKVVWRELLLWLFIFSIISFIYRYALDAYQREFFEELVSYCSKTADQIPLTFMLGFYVTLVVNRWATMFSNIGWIDNIALYLAAFISGTDDQSRMLRRNCIRYTVLSQALVFRNISTPARQRFPTDDALVTAGLMTESERAAMDSVISPHKKNFLPVLWSMTILRRGLKDGRLISDFHLRDLYDKLIQFRNCLSSLSQYDWVPIPLVYTQVVFLTVRCYFLIALIGRQYINPTESRKNQLGATIDLYFPFMSVIVFVFYVGWMKVAEALLNPFGDDDDDFEVNYMIDRNLQIGLTIVDDAVDKIPDEEMDAFWGEIEPEPLYTEETVNRPENPLLGSADDVPIPPEDEVKMVRRPSVMSVNVPLRNENGHRLSVFSNGGTLSRKSSDRMSGRFSDLKDRSSRRLSKSPVTTPSNIVEKGDLPPPLQVFNIPTPTSPHWRSDGTNPSFVSDIEEEIDEQSTNISRY